MKKNTTAKRITAVLLALALSFSLTATAFASTTPADSADDYEVLTAQQVNQETGEPGISPQSVVVLYGPESVTLAGNGDPIKRTVRPAKGTNLKITLATERPEIRISVEGPWWYSKTISVTQAGSHTYDLANNCSNGEYTVKIVGDYGVSCTFQIVQTEYI